METYAAEIVENKVSSVIVGDAVWAQEHLGGTWIDTDSLVGIGWSWTEADGFQPPVAPEPVVEEPAPE